MAKNPSFSTGKKIPWIVTISPGEHTLILVSPLAITVNDLGIDPLGNYSFNS